ncbi:MAG: hypothetical protein L3J26_09170 [Candidatus Polarisedimenticolaceae bacterium]|nr:hypothetical protein [Candidatus Polarisedimenticolaceae bacterium]
MHHLYHFGFLLLILFSPILLADSIAHHDFNITLQPSEGVLKMEDTVSMQNEISEIEFALHQNLKIEASPAFTITPIKSYDNSHSVPVQYYRIQLAQPSKQFSLRYSGTIHHSLQQISKDYAGDLTQTPGIISEEGVYLSATSYWFPHIGTDYLTFSIQAKLPKGWQLISQGDALGDGWEEHSPQNNIYLIAAPYQIYQRKTPIAEAMVYLRTPDPAIADQYLDATEHYLELYSELLGAYPYSKFALVENFWETGYGMPSFTLLGPTVIRLPFIIHTSYPHEILHNWWGNGVYPDYASGNWSEGLTSYLADHLLQEQRGIGADYRRTTLQRYADSVKSQQDFPLTAFRGRHGQASQAIGYGKTMMFFHMLRQRLGDAIFIEGLQHFYKSNLFKVANFDTIRHSFEFVSKTALSAEFKQWTTRVGAPALQLDDVAVNETTTGYKLTAALTQTQTEPVFNLRIPVLIQLEGEEKYQRHLFSMSQRQAILELHFKNQPLRIKIDPQFDLFRQLDPSEIPSSFAQLFGAGKVLIVLPSNAPAEIISEYTKLANNWARHPSTLEIKWDREVKQLPVNQAVWLFGQSNQLLQTVKDSTEGELFSNQAAQFIINKKSFSKATHSIAVAAPNPSNPKHTVGWFAAHAPDVIQRLGRKLPHYKKYSYLVFEGADAHNIYKGKWPLNNSALHFTVDKDQATEELPLTPHPALTNAVKNKQSS